MTDEKTNPDNVNQDPNAKDKGDTSTDVKTVPLQALHEEREKRQSLQAEVEALKEQMSSINNTPPPQTQYTPPPQSNYDPAMGVHGGGSSQYGRLNEMWETDPRTAMRTELMMSLSWYDRIAQGVDNQMDQLAQSDSNFGKYRSKVKNYINRMPIQERNRDGVVKLAYYAVRGENVDSIVAEELEKKKAEILAKIKRGEDVQGFTSGSGTAPKAQAKDLTDEERKAAFALGLSEEDYSKNKR